MTYDELYSLLLCEEDDITTTNSFIHQVHIVHFTANTPSHLNPQSWILDSGATHQMTPNIDNLTLHSDYQGTDAIKIGNGKSLSITHTGSSLYCSHDNIFQFNDILFVSYSCSNLLSIYAFTKANDVLIEFSLIFSD